MWLTPALSSHVQEFLDSSWCTFGSLPPEQQALAFDAVSTAVEQMHKLDIVHGDLRWALRLQSVLSIAMLPFSR